MMLLTGVGKKVEFSSLPSFFYQFVSGTNNWLPECANLENPKKVSEGVGESNCIIGDQS